MTLAKEYTLILQLSFDLAIVKFGTEKVMEILEKHLAPVNELCNSFNLYPFMIAASCEERALCVIYHLLRRSPSSVENIVYTYTYTVS